MPCRRHGAPLLLHISACAVGLGELARWRARKKFSLGVVLAMLPALIVLAIALSADRRRKEVSCTLLDARDCLVEPHSGVLFAVRLDTGRAARGRLDRIEFECRLRRTAFGQLRAARGRMDGSRSAGAVPCPRLSDFAYYDPCLPPALHALGVDRYRDCLRCTTVLGGAEKCCCRDVARGNTDARIRRLRGVQLCGRSQRYDRARLFAGS